VFEDTEASNVYNYLSMKLSLAKSSVCEGGSLCLLL
jgi:hypothetical protein